MTNEDTIQALRELRDHVELRMCTTIEKRLKYRSALNMVMEALKKGSEDCPDGQNGRTDEKIGTWKRVYYDECCWYVCSECGGLPRLLSEYCPCCGVKMKGEER